MANRNRPSNKPTGYSLFTNNYQKTAKKHGQNLSFQDAIAAASKDWEKLSEEEKTSWKETAKDQRRPEGRGPLPRPCQTGPRKTTKGFQSAVKSRTHRDYYHYPEEVSAYSRKRTRDLKDLNGKIFFNSNRQLEWLLDQEFVLVSVIPYVETAQRRFPPAELAVIRFKIRDGVLDIRNYLLALDLAEHPELSKLDEDVSSRKDDPNSGHGIWRGCVEALECNYENVFEQIWAIISQKEFIFCHADHYNEVRGCLIWLRDKYLQSKEAKKGLGPSLIALEELVKVACHYPCEKVPLNKAPEMEEIEEWLRPTILNEREFCDPTAICKFHRDNFNQNCAVRLARTSLWGVCLLVGKYHHEFSPTPPSVPASRIARFVAPCSTPLEVIKKESVMVQSREKARYLSEESGEEDEGDWLMDHLPPPATRSRDWSSPESRQPGNASQLPPFSRR